MLSLRHVYKKFDQGAVLHDFALDVKAGEFFTLLGPSGCGKTTVLRLVAGFEQPDRGTICIDGVRMDGVPAEKRPVHIVFQGYALFPHMTVAKNIAFGLRMKGMGGKETRMRVDEALDLVGLQGFDDRLPSQLSGGQRQRVAIARALVMRPKVLLLDEPFSALDPRLRRQMRSGLKQIQRRSGITFLFVTHDQEEALSLSDHLLVMNDGKVQQVGTPREIYEQPRNLFVAGFIGGINRFDARVLGKSGDAGYRVNVGGVQKQVLCDLPLADGEQVHVLIRPADLRVEQATEDAVGNRGITGRVKEQAYTGQALETVIELDNGNQVRASHFPAGNGPGFDHRSGMRVVVDWTEGRERVIRGEAG